MPPLQSIFTVVVSIPAIVLFPDVNASAVTPVQPLQIPLSYLIDKTGLAVFLSIANCAPEV